MGVYENLLSQGYWPLWKEDDKKPISCCPLDTSPGFKFLFDKYKTWLNNFEGVPAQLVHNKMCNLTEPFLAEFVEVNDSEEFLEICSPFFEYLFWGEKLFVSYEDFWELLANSIPAKDIDETPNNTDWQLVRDNLVLPGKRLHLWYMASAETETKDATFTHLQTGITLSRPEWEKIFIFTSWDGTLKPPTRFCDWYQLSYKMIREQLMIDLAAAICIKRMEIEATEISERDEVFKGAYKKLMDQVNTISPVLGDGINESYIPKIYMTPTELKDFQLSIHLGWDRALSELGRVANTNPKLERLTTGENYKDIVAVANRQRKTLNQLKLFAAQVLDRWGIDLKFALNGIPQRQAPETDIETAGMETSAVDNLGVK